jgi:hypothetical protein
MFRFPSLIIAPNHCRLSHVMGHISEIALQIGLECAMLIYEMFKGVQVV